MADDSYYYLVKEGTNLRVLTKDDIPLIVHEDYLEREIEYFENMMNMVEGSLESIPVRRFPVRRFETVFKQETD